MKIYKLEEITRFDLRAFQDSLKTLEYEPKTINNIMTFLKTSLKEAVADGFINRDPTYRVKRLKSIKKVIDPFSPEEMESFFKHCPEYYQPYFIVSYETAMRPNEEIALKWDNVDLKYNRIAVVEGRASGEEGPPKTESSNREIIISERCREALTRQKFRTKDKTYVFVNTKDNPFRC